MAMSSVLLTKEEANAAVILGKNIFVEITDVGELKTNKELVDVGVQYTSATDLVSWGIEIGYKVLDLRAKKALNELTDELD